MNLRLAIALVLAGLACLWFSLAKIPLGIDFTDEGFYLAAPLRLAMGESLFSSEMLTLVRPFEIVAQFLFFLPGSPSLYEFRLIGWLLHIGAYLLFAWVLFRECRSAAIAALAPAVPFFVSFAWPSTIATPGYKSLSCDFLLVFLACYYAAQRWAEMRAAAGLRVAAGLAIFVASVCYPPLVLIFACTVAFDGWLAWRSPGSRADRGRLALTSLTGLAAGLVMLGWLWASGAAGLWLERIALTQSFALKSVRTGGLAFYGHLFAELFTKMEAFTRHTKVAGVMALFLLIAPKHTLRTRGPVALLLFQIYTLYVLGEHYHGPTYADHFFFPTVYCLAAVTWTGLLVLVEIRLGDTGRPLALFCAGLSIAAGLLYATATYFFDYYYSWNNGILGLTFAFAFALARPLGFLPHDHRRWLLAAGLVVATSYAASYNYYGVRRDVPVGQLTTAFTIPPLQGIRTSPFRQKSVETLYTYLEPRLADDRRLLAFDHAPMLYFILGAKPAYGMAWALQEGIAPPVHEQLVRELLSQPLPKYAVRTLVDVSEADWQTAKPMVYDDAYPLNAAVDRLYRSERVIYPFEVLTLR